MAVDLSPEQLKKIAHDYHQNGYAVIENFFSPQQVQTMLQKISAMIEKKSKQFNPDGKLLPGEVWGEPEKNDHYAAAADGVTRLFYEKTAVDESKMQLKVKRADGLCKMGFALHHDEPYWMDQVRNQRVTDIFRALGYEDPRLVQTMVNFKNPHVGGEFIPHQDAQYLTTTKPEEVVGFWVGLNDATPANGCLEVIPQSHKWALYRKFERIPGGKQEDGSIIRWTAPMAVYDQKMYIKVPTGAGALVLIHGLLVHKSDPNKTETARWAFVFHAWDDAKCKYIDGWLPADCPAFVPIYPEKIAA